MTAVAEDYYAILGVSRNASEDEIKRAYRRLARQHHPDTNEGDADSEARFKEIALAYETLRDPERRRRYDMFGPEGVRGSGAGGAGAGGFPGGFTGGFGDIFDAFFGGGGGGFGGFGGRGRPAAGGRRRGCHRPDLRAGDLRWRGGSASPTAGHVRHLLGQRRPPGYDSSLVSRLRRRRRGPPGAPVDPRADGHVRAVRALPRPRRSGLLPLPGLPW